MSILRSPSWRSTAAATAGYWALPVPSDEASGLWPSEHLAWTIREGKKWRIVADGITAGENYDDLHGPLVFSTPEQFDVILERDQEVLRAECVIDAS